MSLDASYMQRALENARKGKPSPNPPVGAVVVIGDQVVGEGFHAKAGGEHAEVAALRACSVSPKGGTLYVTLEPCNHTGRTGPCTEAIIAAGIARVVFGCDDPNPHVAGGGVERLTKAGIEVTKGVLTPECEKLIAPWTKYVTEGYPFVSLKLALSLDGRIASRTGASKWVTGREARARVHALRAEHDAVSVGIGTVLADDPKLTVRHSEGVSPTRIVWDTKLRTPLLSKLVESAAEVPTWILAAENASESIEEQLLQSHVQVIRCPISQEGRIDPNYAMKELAKRGIVRLMIEGGAELAGSILAHKLADELHAFLAPILLGPLGRPGAVDWAGPTSPEIAPRIDSPTWELCGGDAHVFGPLLYPDE